MSQERQSAEHLIAAHYCEFTDGRLVSIPCYRKGHFSLRISNHNPSTASRKQNQTPVKHIHSLPSGAVRIHHLKFLPPFPQTIIIISNFGKGNAFFNGNFIIL